MIEDKTFTKNYHYQPYTKIKTYKKQPQAVKQNQSCQSPKNFFQNFQEDKQYSHEDRNNKSQYLKGKQQLGNTDHLNSKQLTKKELKVHERNSQSNTNQTATSPKRQQPNSPIRYKQSLSPRINQSNIISNQSLPIRSNLKNLLQSGNSYQINSYHRESIVNDSKQVACGNRNNKTITQFYASSNVQKQNQILKQQNILLKNELNEIKKNLLFGPASRKEQIISNLRDTIKKEDTLICQLRLKLDIFTKKNVVLTELLQNKDEEISFLTHKVAQIQSELQDYKENNANTLEKLKQKLNFILKSYNELQAKTSKEQLEWLMFKQKWIQQKNGYIERIKFLENYINQYQ